MSFWVLVDSKGNYFCEFLAVGPRYTIDQHKAATFATKAEALRSPAYTHPFADCEPKQIGARR